MGLTQGFAILIAQHFGAKEYRLLRKSVAMSIVLAAAIAVVMSVLLQILAEPGAAAAEHRPCRLRRGLALPADFLRRFCGGNGL
ncbi:MAG: MATE family efflux transporter [[Clostridium] leptum]